MVSEEEPGGGGAMVGSSGAGILTDSGVFVGCDGAGGAVGSFGGGGLTDSGVVVLGAQDAKIPPAATKAALFKKSLRFNFLGFIFYLLLLSDK